MITGSLKIHFLEMVHFLGMSLLYNKRSGASLSWATYSAEPIILSEFSMDFYIPQRTHQEESSNIIVRYESGWKENHITIVPTEYSNGIELGYVEIGSARIAADIASNQVNSLEIQYISDGTFAISADIILNGELIGTLNFEPGEVGLLTGDVRQVRSSHSLIYLDNIVFEAIPEPSLYAFITAVSMFILVLFGRRMRTTLPL